MIRHGFTLLEIAVAMVVGLILLSFAVPAFNSYLEDSRWQLFVSELTGHMVGARKQARLAQTSVFIDLNENAERRFETRYLAADGSWLVQDISHWRGPYNRSIRIALPEAPLEHPTQSKAILNPLVSTHAPKVFFGPSGASSGTLVFSDGKRAACVVLSGQSGRLRVFQTRAGHTDWQRFF